MNEKVIKTNRGDFKVINIVSRRENSEDTFSCHNDCRNCNLKCDLGIGVMELIYGEL